MKNKEIVNTRKIFINVKQCPSCGAKSFLGIMGKKCFWCGKIFCGNCMPKWQSSLVFKIVSEGKQRKDAIYRSVGFCSDKCSNDFWNRVLSFPAEDSVETDITNFNKNWIKYWNKSILSALQEAKDESAEQVKRAAQIHTEKYAAFPYYDSENIFLPQAKKSQYNAKIALAQNLVACGRPLDAANIYEKLKLYDKARTLREKDKRIIIKKTDISVNLNSLLQQFRNSGMVAVYRCPHCGGKLKVGKDSSIESLRTCEHCGSEVETMDLVDLLEKALE